MQRFRIRIETHSYYAFQALDFGEAEAAKQIIIDEVFETTQNWEERLCLARDEISAFSEVRSLSPANIPSGVFQKIKEYVSHEYRSYSMQLDEIKRRIAQYQYVEKTRAAIGPIYEILTRMENIIGSECYNGNIQNYSSWGAWEGEGRSFRYPVTYIYNGQEQKHKNLTVILKPEVLITGYYKFGANELNIYRALVRIVDMLRSEYGLKIGPSTERLSDSD